MRYVVFTRVSTGKQTTENQMIECQKYLSENVKEGDEVIRFDEKALTTRTPIAKRPVVQKMLDELRKGDTLVVYKVSRLARAGDELVNTWHLLQKKGVILVSLYEPGIDEMTIHAYAMVAQAERRNIREATISGLKRKRAKGEMTGSCRYGYQLDLTKVQTQHADARSFGKPYLVTPAENEQQQVALMLKLHDEGYSYGQIANELAILGYKNRNGNNVTKSTVHQVVTRLKKLQQTPTAGELIGSSGSR